MQKTMITKKLSIIISIFLGLVLITGITTVIMIARPNSDAINSSEYNASSETDLPGYVGNLLTEDGSSINFTTYNNLITKLGALGSVDGEQKASAINGGTPVVFQMGTEPTTSNPIYWQVVYRTDDIITIWMTQPYTASLYTSTGVNNTYYELSDLKSNTDEIYNDLSATYSVFDKIIVTPQELINSTNCNWQTIEQPIYLTNITMLSSLMYNYLNANTLFSEFWVPSAYETYSLWGMDESMKSYPGDTLDGETISAIWLRSLYLLEGANRSISNVLGTSAVEELAYGSMAIVETTPNRIGVSGFAGINPDGETGFISSRGLLAGIRPAAHISLSNIAPKNITINYNFEQGNVTGGGEYLQGDSVTLIATPADNYRFVSWTNSEGQVLSTNSTYTFEATDDITIIANFELTYNVTINVNDHNLGQVLYNNQLNTTINVNNVAINTNLTNFYAIANINSAILCWQITTASGTTYNYNNPPSILITADTTITAVFTNSLMEGVGVTAIGGGQARIGGYDGNIDENTQVVLNAICYSGYNFDGWYTMVNGALTKIDALGNSAAVTINASTYEGKLIIARFVPTNIGNVNQDTNNS